MTPLGPGWGSGITHNPLPVTYFPSQNQVTPSVLPARVSTIFAELLQADGVLWSWEDRVPSQGWQQVPAHCLSASRWTRSTAKVTAVPSPRPRHLALEGISRMANLHIEKVRQYNEKLFS